jgi:hypothetical protein
METLLAFLILGLLIFLGFFAYKKRFWISMWMEDESQAIVFHPKMRRLKLQRKIEDAQLGLEILDEIENKK